MTKIKIIEKILIMTLLVFSVSCSSDKVKNINGAGASFPFPLYSELFEKYYKKTKIKVNYQSIGSGGGIRQIAEDIIDFGATDAFIKDKNLKKIEDSKGRKLLHIPIVLGGVVLAYNLESEVDNLKLDGETIAKIFSGKIVKWDDLQIKALNPGATLPGAPIIVVRRSDGSGTTFAFSDFLASQSPDWKKEVGVGKSLKWFEGSLGAKGNEGVTGSIKQSKNSIGYVSLNYALELGLSVALVKNNQGNFIAPSVESVSLSADTQIPEDTRINLTSIAEVHPNSYPISTFTWIVFYEEQAYKKRTQSLAKELKSVLFWMLNDEAQELANRLYYAPLPPKIREDAKKIIDKMVYQGKSL